jgi:hypothetical protein
MIPGDADAQRATTLNLWEPLRILTLHEVEDLGQHE